MRVAPRKVEADYPRPAARSEIGAAEPAYAVWRPTSNHSSPGGVTPAFVIIHSCEGSYAGCWGWLANPSSGVSTHYVVNDDGSEVSQMVYEANRAWHVGVSYDCALNEGTECWRDGMSINAMSISVEHAGYAAQTYWDEGLLDTSAQVVCDATADHGIPRDRFHILAHGQIQPYNRTDPGPNWPWTDYIERVRTACGDDPLGGTPTGRQVVIDSNQGYNGPDTEIEVSSAWLSSTNVPGYFNTGYWAGPTASTSDAARFWFYEDQDRCYRVDAWWTSAGDRATAAPFIAYDASDTEVGRMYVDQQQAGGQWNVLGTWSFTAGWNHVALSRWTASGDYVIADAVRLTESIECDTPDPRYALIIDSDDAVNGADAYVETFGTWSTSTSTAGFYGQDYLVASTQGRSRDRAMFGFFIDQPRTLAVDLWWTEGSSRSDRAPVAAFGDSVGLLGVTRVDQTVNGSQWNEVATYDFPAGWNKIGVVARDRAGSVVIADAVRVREP